MVRHTGFLNIYIFNCFFSIFYLLKISLLNTQIKIFRKNSLYLKIIKQFYCVYWRSSHDATRQVGSKKAIMVKLIIWPYFYFANREANIYTFNKIPNRIQLLILFLIIRAILIKSLTLSKKNSQNSIAVEEMSQWPRGNVQVQSFEKQKAETSSKGFCAH